MVCHGVRQSDTDVHGECGRTVWGLERKSAWTLCAQRAGAEHQGRENSNASSHGSLEMDEQLVNDGSLSDVAELCIDAPCPAK